MARRSVWLGLALLSAFTFAARAAPPDDVSDLVGARGSSGEVQLQARGYAHVRTTTVGDAKYSFWWNARRTVCASVATRDGRYAAIDAVPAANCEREGGASLAASDGPPADHLMLICWGEGEKPSSEYRSGYEWDSKERKYVRTSRVETTTAHFDAELLVEITGDTGRIKLPRSLVPPINSGGSRGWWDLDELRVSAQTISGRYRLNGLNKPRVNIDRRIGRIKVDGMSDFAGTCEDATKAENNPRF